MKLPLMSKKWRKKNQNKQSREADDIPKRNMTIKHLSDTRSLKSKRQIIPNSHSVLEFIV